MNLSLDKKRRISKDYKIIEFTSRRCLSCDNRRYIRLLLSADPGRSIIKTDTL